MTRLTHLLNPSNAPASFFFPSTPIARRNLTTRFFAPKSYTPNTPTRSPKPKPIPHNRRKIHLFPTPMDATGGALSPESDISSAPPEDFVHVQNPNPNPNPNSYSELVDGVEASGSEDYSVKKAKILSGELAKGVVVLQCESSVDGGSCDVYLVGTAHVSQESCREVQAVISFLKPQVVFLELCSSRVAILTPQNLKVPTMSEMMDMWKKNMNIFGILYSWFLAKVADKLEVFPGSEFRVAFEEARNYGATVILGDRPVQITLRRTWGKMSTWHKAKFLYYMFFQAIFLPSTEDLNKMLKVMDDVDMLTLVVQEMSKAFPSLMETLLYERDLSR
eukprot:TRINITY_DN2819_c0_g2_i1.p1 TRINITY_DN2819_c0_g2~~TRINITY_DN2819_c0_g2_i1.p1  ORF type:complete len:334 (-),score=45.67 TRINITY_DN2819_c0_g2_i1:59-1060(-)